MARSLGSIVRSLASVSQRLTGNQPMPGISEWLYGQPWMTGDESAEFDHAKAAALVSTVYACISLISRDLAGLPMRFYRARGGEFEELPFEHELPTLWRKGNPEQTGYETNRDWTANGLAIGSSYLFLERGPNLARKPFEYWSVPGHLLREIPGPNRRVVAYKYLPTNVEYAAESFVPLRWWNPNWSPLEPAPRGMSPLSAARPQYETKWRMGNWANKFFERGGNASMILKAPADVVFRDSEIKSQQDRLDARFGGIKNIGKPVILAGLDFVRTGLTTQEMDFVNVGKEADLAICRVFNVPPVLIGAKDGGGMSDAGATTDLLLYAVNCIAPLARMISEVVTARLCPIYGPDIVAELDTSGMLAMQTARLEQAKSLQTLTGRPVLSVDEARAALEYEPLPNGAGEDVVVPFNVMPSSALTEPPAPPPVSSPEPTAATAESASRTAAKVAAAAGDGRAFLRRYRDADLARYERRVGAFARSYFTRQEKRVLERIGAVQASRIARYTVGDDLLPRDDDGVDEAQALFMSLVADRGAAAAAEIGAEVALDVFNARLESLIRGRAARMVSQVDDTTRAQLADAVASIVAEGGSVEDVARAVRQVFNGRRANALTIARTETAWAYNLGAKEAWKLAGVSSKSWLTVNDDAVRPSHSECESLGVIPMEGVFPNGLQYPGDPGGPADETINCRCVLQPEFEPADLEQVARRNGSKRDRRAVAEVMGW